jgi:hypothetical protein
LGFLLSLADIYNALPAQQSAEAEKPELRQTWDKTYSDQLQVVLAKGGRGGGNDYLVGHDLGQDPQMCTDCWVVRQKPTQMSTTRQGWCSIKLNFIRNSEGVRNSLGFLSNSLAYRYETVRRQSLGMSFFRFEFCSLSNKNSLRTAEGRYNVFCESLKTAELPLLPNETPETQKMIAYAIAKVDWALPTA